MNTSEQVHTKVRIPIYDYARVFVAYLVILGHCLPDDDMRLRPYIYAFHMPFFFLVSGMLYKEVGYIPWKKLCRTLIYPFIFFNLFFIIFTPFLIKFQLIPHGNYTNANYPILVIYKQYISHIIIQFILGKSMPNGPTWFLLALLWCKIMMHIMNRNKYLLIAVITIIIASTLYKIFWFKIGSALMVMPFFFVGFKFKLSPIEFINKKYAIALGIVFISISVILTYFNGKTSTNIMIYGDIVKPLNILAFYINAFVASYGVLLIFKTFKSNSIFTYCANALITILCIQRLFYAIFHKLGDRDSIIICILASIIIFVVCVCFHYLINKYIPIVIGKTKQQTEIKTP